MNHPAKAEVDEIFASLLVYSDHDYRQLSRRDRYVWDVSWMDTAIMDGGLDSWMSLMGHHAAETLEALQDIGAPQAHRVIKRVCDLFPTLVPGTDEETVAAQPREFFQQHGKIDDYLMAHDGPNGIADVEVKLDLYQRLLDYWRRADPNER